MKRTWALNVECLRADVCCKNFSQAAEPSMGDMCTNSLRLTETFPLKKTGKGLQKKEGRPCVPSNHPCFGTFSVNGRKYPNQIILAQSLEQRSKAS